ncbi:MAG: hypothetical protein R3A80_12160 [Bdellovibrionota bacterium]
MMWLLLPLYFFSTLSFASELTDDEGVAAVVHGTLEFTPEEVQKEVNANWRASTGALKTESFELSWSPDGTRVIGTPEKIAQELATIQESLSHYPLLAPLGSELRAYENGTVLDLGKFLTDLRKKLDHNCGNCFSFVLCAMGKKERGVDFPELEKELQANYKKEKSGKWVLAQLFTTRETF